jgi:hypothetical protein
MGSAFVRYLRFRLSLWLSARLLPFRVRHRPLSEILQLLESSHSVPYRGLAIEHVLRCVRRTARRPILMRDRRCLREGLLAFEFLDGAGHKVELHFGIDTTTLSSADLKAHCWIVCNNETVLNPPDANIKPILVYRDGVATTPIPAGLGRATLD